MQKSSDYQRPNEPEFVYTGLVLRGIAYLVDVLLIIAVWICLWSAPFLEPLARPLLGFLLISVTFLYFLIGWGEFGTTVGMRIFRLSIVRTTDGLQIGYIRALVRIVVFVATSLVIPTFILIIPVLLGRHRRAIHDYAAGSAVIRPAHGRFAFVRGSATA